ncbi:MAG TPA: hypothetical protein VFA45_00465 [Actinomycetes bacterium]|nr:hypothetical protein [Actinomycetes bacterium]
MDECDWTRCAAPARLDVLLGQTPIDAERVGAFCVPHASLCSLDAQHQAGSPAWYDWHRPAVRSRLADAVAEPARVSPLFRKAGGRHGELPDAQAWVATDVGEP